MRLFVVIGIALCVASCGERKSRQYEKHAKRIAAELDALGVRVDRSALRFEVGWDGKAERDLDRQQDLFYREGHFEGLYAARRALGLQAFGGARGLRRAAVQGIGQTVAAYYQHDRKALVFMQNAMARLNDPDQLVAHELVHAYQDQQAGGLRAYLDRPTLDQITAAHALLEGAAEVTSAGVLLARNGKTLDTVPASAFDGSMSRLLVGEQVSGVYEVGAKHQLARFKAGQWKLSDPTPGPPPTSTEQLIYAHKLGRDTPTAIELPRWTGGSLVSSDTFGQLMLYHLLLDVGAERETRARVQSLATGWDGDRYQVYRTEGDTWAIAWRILFDREADAVDFELFVEARTPSRIRRHGGVVDIAFSEDLATLVEVAQFLRDAPAPPAPPASDGESTAAAERALSEAMTRGPVVEGGRWVHGDVGVSMPVPDGFEQVQRRGNHMLVAAGDDGEFRDNISLIVAPDVLGANIAQLRDETRAQFDRMGIGGATIEITTIADRPALLYEFAGKVPGFAPRIHTLGCLILARDKQIVITATVLRDQWPAREASIRAALAGTRLH